MTTEILETLHDDLQTSREQNEAEFLAFARLIAGGETPDSTEIEKCLQSLGREFSDLASCVALIGRRRVWLAELEAAEAADDAERQARESIAAADAELEAARVRHQQVTADHWAAIHAAAATKAAAGQARLELANSRNVPDPAARRRLENCRSAIARLVGRLRELGNSSWAKAEVARVRQLLSRERQVEASLLAELLNS